MRRLLIAGSIILSTLVGGCSRPSDNTRSVPDEVRPVAEALLADSAAAFASAVSYPLDRPYPLHAIEDSVQMVNYYPTMVD
ncbi:MAG: hypothetical protein K2K72_05610, partial [Duncaniella sp.]|nr:hypothetical protein [Duncaniella sp.]